jgi:hypothetical protein
MKCSLLTAWRCPLGRTSQIGCGKSKSVRIYLLYIYLFIVFLFIIFCPPTHHRGVTFFLLLWYPRTDLQKPKELTPLSGPLFWKKANRERIKQFNEDCTWGDVKGKWKLGE